MKKIITIGATAMMSFTSLGGLQLISQATADTNSPVVGAIHTFSKELLGDATAYAAEADMVNIPDANLKAKIKEALNVTDDNEITEKKCRDFTGDLDFQGIKISNLEGLQYFTNINSLRLTGCDLTQEVVDEFDFKVFSSSMASLYINQNHLYNTSRIPNFASVYGNWESGQTVTESKQTITTTGTVTLDVSKYQDCMGPGSVNFERISNDGVYDEATNTITWKNLDLSTESVSFHFHGTSYLDGNVVVPLEVQKVTTTDVTYDAQVTPGEPSWYGVVNSAITFNEQNKNSDLDASVKIVDANDQTESYKGNKVVAVKVKSTNGFELKDNAKTPVEYHITNGNNQDLAKNDSEQDLGTVTGEKNAGDKQNVIESKAKLIGVAQDSGKYVDTLNYHFIEQ
ncbi:MAG: Ig-like domain-containing protein [Enterococcus hulanensis]